MPAAASELAAAARTARAWPFEEARRLIERLEKVDPAGTKPVIFETGYGPSGLPHIGTFGEVARTSMVRHAFEVLTQGRRKTRLICISDDMDGLRKVPDNVPSPERIAPYLQKPLTAVPDPFGTHASYGAHMNARLCAFLDTFGFDYEFLSATELYKSGRFDETLLKALAHFDDIMGVMLPTLGEERRKTYSPFLPISPSTGRVLYVPMKRVDAAAGTITFDDEDGSEVTTLVTGGRTKLQWKPDFGMRWAALGVDFEMFGKDHQTNAPVYSAITRILGAEPPVQYVYELFLDDKGEKISKSKGNGISIDEWLTYASPESLSLYMFQKPRTAKKLYFDVIPKAVDEYLTFLSKHAAEPADKQLENPVWHIHAGRPPAATLPISFALLLNLAAVSNAEDKAMLWGFIRRYAPDATPATQPILDNLAGYAIAYYRDFVKPAKVYRAATEGEAAAMRALDSALATLPAGADATTIQNLVTETGKANGYTPETLRGWYQALYQVLLGQTEGPRIGPFIALYGVEEMRALIGKGVAGELVVEK